MIGDVQRSGVETLESKFMAVLWVDIMPTRLESLLELALRTSTANIDPYKDDLKYLIWCACIQSEHILLQAQQPL